MLARIILIPLILLVLALGLFLGGQNAGVVSLDYYFGTIEMRLAVVLILALLVGICLGALAVYLGVVIRLKFQLRKARKGGKKEPDLNRLTADT